MTRLRIIAAGFSFVAVTNPDAPLTVAAFLKLLPYRQKLMLIAYGLCSFASKMGPLAGNHFLTVVEGKDNLRPLGKRVLMRARSKLGELLRTSLIPDVIRA